MTVRRFQATKVDEKQMDTRGYAVRDKGLSGWKISHNKSTVNMKCDLHIPQALYAHFQSNSDPTTMLANLQTFKCMDEPLCCETEGISKNRLCESDL